MLHSEERRLLSVPDLYPFTDGFLDEIMFEEKAKKVRDFENNSKPYIVNAGFCQLDVNDHVNNTKYANYVLDAINPSKDDIISAFQIDYRKEVMQGTQLNVYYEKEDNIITAKGENNDGDIMFACKMEF